MATFNYVHYDVHKRIAATLDNVNNTFDQFLALIRQNTRQASGTRVNSGLLATPGAFPQVVVSLGEAVTYDGSIHALPETSIAVAPGANAVSFVYVTATGELGTGATMPADAVPLALATVNSGATALTVVDLRPVVTDALGSIVRHTYADSPIIDMTQRKANAPMLRMSGPDGEVFAINSAGDMTFAGSLIGDGTGLTLDLAQVVAGTLADGRLSTNIPLKDAANVFTTTQVVQGAHSPSQNYGLVVQNNQSGVSLQATGLKIKTDGAGTYRAALEYNDAGLVVDVLSFGRTNATFSTNLTVSGTTGFIGKGGSITDLNAANVATGTLADGRLSANIPLKNAANTFTGTNAFTRDSGTVLAVRVPSDTQNRLTVYAGGDLYWGPGGTVTADTNLYRSAVGTLKTDGGLIVAGTVTAGLVSSQKSAATNSVMLASVTGDANWRFHVMADGRLEWGNGTDARDTNLYRTAVNGLRTDGAFTLGGLLTGASATFSGNVVVNGGNLYSTGIGLTVKGDSGLTLSSNGSVIVTIDDDNNDTTARFAIKTHGAAAIDILTVGQGGDLTAGGRGQFTSGANGQSRFRHTSGYGGVTIEGPAVGSSAVLTFGNSYETTFSEKWRVMMDGASSALGFHYGSTPGAAPNAAAFTLASDNRATFSALLTAAGGLTVTGALTLPNNSVADTALSSNVALENAANSFSALQTIITASGPQLNFGAAAKQGALFAIADGAYLTYQTDIAAGGWTARGTSASFVKVDLGVVRIYANTGLTDGATYTPTQIASFATTGLTLTGALAVSNGISLSGGDVVLFRDPSADLHAATKRYVDQVAAGLTPKDSVRVTTTANITLSGTQTIDGVALIAGDRVLVKNQTTASQNGIYVVAAGAWTRAADADEDAEVRSGMNMYILEGATQGSTNWTLTTPNPIVVGTTALNFTQTSGAAQLTAGAGMTRTANSFDIVALDGTIVVQADGIALGAVPDANLSSNVAFKNATNTFTGNQTVAGALVSANATAGSNAFFTTVTGDTHGRIVVTADGKMNWGPGNAIQDVNLYRSAANTLKTDDTFEVAGNFTLAGTAYFNKAGTLTAGATLFNSGTGVLAAQFGSGSATGISVDTVGGAVRFNGSGVLWGDVGFFPTSGGADRGQFRFMTTSNSLGSAPNAKVGVGALYSAGQVMIGTYAPATSESLFNNGNIFNSGYLLFGNSANAYKNVTAPILYGTGTGGTGFFAEAGHLVLEPRLNGAVRSVMVMGVGGNPFAVFNPGATSLRLGTGISNASAQAILDVQDSANRSQIAFGAADGQGFLRASNEATHLTWGVHYNGAAYIPKQTTGGILALTGAEMAFFTNSGLTVDTGFSPTKVFSVTNGVVSLLAGAGNRVEWAANGVAAPSATSVSAGTKLLLYPAANTNGYSMGVASSNLWFNVPTNTTMFTWNVAAVEKMRLYDTGLSIGTGANATAMLDVLGMAKIAGITSLEAPGYQLHFGSAADGQAYLRGSANNANLYYGYTFDGSNFVAKQVSAAGYTLNRNGTNAWQHLWYGNTGLTPGNTFTPDVQMELTATGLGLGTTPGAKLDVNGTMRVTGQSIPAAGAGVEVEFNADVGRVQAYDRSALAWRNLLIRGLTVELHAAGAAQVTVHAGRVSMNNATSNMLDFGVAGVAIPGTTGGSVGTKVRLYDVGTGSTGYAIGVESGYLWFNQPGQTGSTGYKWYAQGSNHMTLTGEGNLSVTGKMAIAGNDLAFTGPGGVIVVNNNYLDLRANSPSRLNGIILRRSTAQTAFWVNIGMESDTSLLLAANNSTTGLHIDNTGKTTADGGLSAPSVEVKSTTNTNKFTIEYNETDDSLDFVFA